MTDASRILYKVMEVAPVTEESLEAAVNERASEGWGFESIHFVMREGSHRPPMAYLFFTRVRDPRSASTRRAQGQPDEAGTER